jgi:hypothetical protein
VISPQDHKDELPPPPPLPPLINISRTKLVVLCLLAGLGWFGYKYGTRRYASFVQERLVQQAKSSLETKSYRSAYLSAEEALQRNGADVGAIEVMRDLAEKVNSPAAMFWQQRLLRMRGISAEGVLRLARQAIAFNELSIADQSLLLVPEADRNSLAYHQVAAALGIALKDYSASAFHWKKAAELAPNDPSIKFNMAAVRLENPNAAERDKARAALELLSREPEMASKALAALMADAARSGDRAKAADFAKRLDELPQANFEDHLPALQFVYTGADPFAKRLGELRKQAGDDVGSIFRLMTWLNSHGAEQRTLDWARELSLDLRTQMPVPLAICEAHVIAGNWTALKDFVTPTDWHGLDFLRMAFYSRAAKELGLFNDARSKWQGALQDVDGDPQKLYMLARLVGDWKWHVEREEVLWIIANGPASQRQALQELYRIYRDSRETRQLYRVAARVVALEPRNPIARNNYAFLSFLLKQNLEEAFRIAESNFQEHPKEPAIVSSYALSLYLQERRAEAVKVIQTLNPEQLRSPEVAGCYGVLLASTGETNQAQPYLQLASAQPNSLPEEVRLWEKALVVAPKAR